MRTSWSHFDRDFDHEFAILDDLRRRMDRIAQNFGVPWREDGRPGLATAWPRANLYDNGTELVLQAELPGLTQKDIQLTAIQDSLVVAGERKPDAPEGYSVHRQERGHVKFSRSFALPCKVNVERISATMKNGILTIQMAKAAESQPRQISVKAQ